MNMDDLLKGLLVLRTPYLAEFSLKSARLFDES